MALLLSAAAALTLSAWVGGGPLAGVALAQPVNSTPPQITTNAWVGQTLTLTPGTWTGAGTVSDVWMECDSSGSNCQNTGFTGTTWFIGNSDANHTLMVQETATGTPDQTMDSNTTFAIQPGPPSNQTPPSINQTTVTQDQPLTVTDGTWSEPEDSVVYQWERCDGSGSNCSAISGATQSSYTPTRDDAGDTLVVTEAPVYGPTTLSATPSAASSAVVATVPSNTSQPTISGSPIVGQTLTASPGMWTNEPTSYSYVWQRCSGGTCQDVPDGGPTYVLTSDDVGSAIQVWVAASVDSTTGGYTQSPATAIVEPPAPVEVSEPTVSGTPLQGDTLTASPGTWSNVTSYDYQWGECASSDCGPISGATGSTYTLTALDVGRTIYVGVSGVGPGGTATAVNSGATGPVQTTSTVTLMTSPGAADVNQLVTLVATVISRSPVGPPVGTVQFADRGTPISGCASVAVNGGGSTATVLCRAAFGGEQAHLVATFTPSASSVVLGSSSPTVNLTVGQDTTTTAIDASAQVKVGSSTTYTATVAPPAGRASPLLPTGAVGFYDGKRRIPACAQQPILGGAATCTVTYTNKGTHRIAANYDGSASFLPSRSPTKTVTVSALPVKGTVTATMQWTFHYTPTYTKVVAMVINGAPTGGNVQLQCKGKGCPFTTTTRSVGKSKSCAKKGSRACPAPGRVALTSAFKGRPLGVGAKITVMIRRSQYVGKYYRFTVRARRQPAVLISCLAAGQSKPGVGCRASGAARR